jgi:NADPH-dependent 2,4-dienoyl-CoA reductase/sulfur reductase-like enzyme
MTPETVDVAIIGGGPAGLAAAATAAALGASVVLLDEQASPGGQIYRSITSAPPQRIATLGPDYAAGAVLTSAFAASGARHEGNAAVWQVTRERTVHFVQHGATKTLDARQVILCTGALERPFPIPGWTLPGVLTAGAAQILLKSADAVPAGPVVLAGCGPLLYLLGWQYLRAGAPISAVVDTTGPRDYRRALPHLAGALPEWRALLKGASFLRALRRAGVPFHTGARALAVEGEQAASALRFEQRGVTRRIDAQLILLHQGVVPHTQFSWSLRAAHRWDTQQLCWVPQTDAWGQLDVPGIFVAGDSRGIGGAQAAAEQGRLAALAAACCIGRIDAARRDALAVGPMRALRGVLRIRPFLDALYRPKDEHRIPADDVVVCRCEEVTAAEIRGIVRLGVPGPNQAKAFSRCGMGPCQGRQCGLSVTELIAAERGVSPAQVGYYRIRPPLKPLTLGELAGAAEPADESGHGGA